MKVTLIWNYVIFFLLLNNCFQHIHSRAIRSHLVQCCDRQYATLFTPINDVNCLRHKHHLKKRINTMKIAFVFVCSNALSNHVVISPPTFGCDWLWFWLSLGEVCPLSAHRPIIIDRGHSYHHTESIVTMKQSATKQFIFVPWTQLCPEGLWVFPMVGCWRVVCGQLWLSAFRGWSFRRVRIGMGLRPICYAQKC